MGEQVDRPSLPRAMRRAWLRIVLWLAWWPVIRSNGSPHLHAHSWTSPITGSLRQPSHPPQHARGCGVARCVL